MPAVYEATLVPPGAVLRAGIAWMDTKLLSARLYSGSISPGGLGYKFTAPVLPNAAATLVAAFKTSTYVLHEPLVPEHPTFSVIQEAFIISVSPPRDMPTAVRASLPSMNRWAFEPSISYSGSAWPSSR